MISHIILESLIGFPWEPWVFYDRRPGSRMTISLHSDRPSCTRLSRRLFETVGLCLCIFNDNLCYCHLFIKIIHLKMFLIAGCWLHQCYIVITLKLHLYLEWTKKIVLGLFWTIWSEKLHEGCCQDGTAAVCMRI